jgi:hypothetical protein
VCIVGWFVVAVVGLATPAAAQIPSCGATATSLAAWQDGSDPRVALIARTTRQVTGCLQSVQVEAWVNGAGTASVHRGTYSAEVYKGVPVSHYGNWRVFSKHWLINVWVDWVFLGTDSRDVEVSPPAVASAQDECYMLGGEWWDGQCQWLGCPILIDTARDGYRLTSVEDGVLFDLDADGTPEPIAWTRPDSDDGWLAMDRNGNGVIDNGRELFGNYTPVRPDDDALLAANGFEALTFTEGPEYGRSLPDLRITKEDVVYGRLLLWRDRNHNGVSEPDELVSASDAGLVGISTEYKSSRRRDRFGNEFRQRARVWWLDPDGRRMADHAFDVWLRTVR